MLKTTPVNILILTKFFYKKAEKVSKTFHLETNLSFFNNSVCYSPNPNSSKQCHMTMAAQQDMFKECLVPC